jgi:hypothetical protein
MLPAGFKPVERAMKCCLIAVLLACLCSDGNAQTPQPRWTVNLQQQSGLRPFGTQVDLLWTKQQGVVFLNADTVAVFQVNEVREPARLSKRTASGGAGNFYLEVRVFDARDGHALKSLHLITSANFSKVVPTHDGKFIMRLGDMVYLLSADFAQLASRQLRFKREAPTEYWQVDVSSSGSEVVLVHDQVFSASDSHLEKEGKAQADVEILNADTLQTTKAFTVLHYISAWTAADGFLVTFDPAVPADKREFGFLDYQGQWSASPLHGGKCHYNMVAYYPRSLAAYGCGQLHLLSSQGEKLFSRKYDERDIAGSVAGDEHYLAMEFDTIKMREIPSIKRQVPMPSALRIEAYNLSDGKRLLSIPVKSDDVYYAVSLQGTLAVVDGTTFKLFQLEK